MTAWLSHQQL